MQDGRCYSCGIGTAESDIHNPSGTLLLVDSYWGNFGADGGPAFANIFRQFADPAGELWQTASGGADGGDGWDPRHLGGMNVAFVFGHVKWLKKENLLYKPSGWNGSCYEPTYNSEDTKYIWNRY